MTDRYTSFPALSLLAGAFMLGVSSMASAQTARIGPSFDCAMARDALSSLICGNDVLAWQDLRFVQAYQALRVQVGDAGQTALRREAVDFQAQVYAGCNLPKTGLVPYPWRPQAEACVLKAYQNQREAWVARLSPPLQEEANRPLQQHLQLQAVLQRLGFIPAVSVVDGVYGTATRSAIIPWQVMNNLPPSGILSGPDAELLFQAGNNAPVPVQPPLPVVPINTTPAPPIDQKALRAAEDMRLQISRAEAEKARAEAEKAQADAERANAEAAVYAAKERAEEQAREKAAELARAEQEAHGVQP